MSPSHPVEETVKKHMANSEAIIHAIAKNSLGINGQMKPDYLDLNSAKEYQKYVYTKFKNIIGIPPFDYMSKTKDSWIMINDRRREIAVEIALITARHGIGVGMLVLHAHQMQWSHIPLKISTNGRDELLTEETSRANGVRGENIIYVPVRAFRGDFTRLAELNIVKPRALWNNSQIVSHESDDYPCFYCSAGEINPSEVVVNISGPCMGLSRNYTLGFTFSPFGNPMSVVHFLAWDCAKNPFNMSRVPMTVSDLIEMTRQINLSIAQFFAGTEVTDYPIIDGVSNGWAGNTIYHQHFQFFQPEYKPPILNGNLQNNNPVLKRDDVLISDLSWEVPVFKVSADHPISVGLVGNDLAGIWRLLGGLQKVPFKTFQDGHIPAENEKVPVHTQNLYVPGKSLGKEAYLLLRDIRRVKFEPNNSDYVDGEKKLIAQKKTNIGVLEASGTMIVDDHESFLEMATWEPATVSRQIDMMVKAVCPNPKKTETFRKSIRGLFPQ